MSTRALYRLFFCLTYTPVVFGLNGISTAAQAKGIILYRQLPPIDCPVDSKGNKSHPYGAGCSCVVSANTAKGRVNEIQAAINQNSIEFCDSRSTEENSKNQRRVFEVSAYCEAMNEKFSGAKCKYRGY